MKLRKIQFSKVKHKRHAHQDSSLVNKKADLRKELMGQFDNPKVLDCFCGNGEMWDKGWGKTSNYVGLDIREYKDERSTIVTKNEPWVKANDISSFDIFDLDAYGTPFPLLLEISKRPLRKGKIGLVLTDGSGRNACSSTMNLELLKNMGLRPHLRTQAQYKYREQFFFKMLEKCADNMGKKIGAYRVIKVPSKSRPWYFTTTLQ